MKNHLNNLKSQCSYANVMVTALAFVVLGGTATAALQIGANSVGAAEIEKNGVGSSEIRKSAVGGSEIENGSIGTREFIRDSVTGTAIGPDAIHSEDIANGEVKTLDLDEDAVTGAEVADNSLGGGDIDESSLDVLRPGACQDGPAKGFARIPAPTTGPEEDTPGVYTSHPSFIADAYNCAGQAAEVRVLTGTFDGKPTKFPIYLVRFPGSGAEVATVTAAQSVNQGPDEALPASFGVTRIDSGPDEGAFRVDATTSDGNFGWFALNVPFYIVVH